MNLKALNNLTELNHTYFFMSILIMLIRIGVVIILSFIILNNGIKEASFISFFIFGTMLLDVLDGDFFKKSTLDRDKDWRIKRRILDSTIDRLIIHVGSISLLIFDPSYLPFYLIILFRELILSTQSIYRYFSGYLVYPSFISKLSCSLIGIGTITYINSLEVLTKIVFVLLFVTSLISFRDYQNRYKKYRDNASNVHDSHLIEVF